MSSSSEQRPPSSGSGRDTLADSTCYNCVGERKRMRVFICHENGRSSLDLPEGKTVADIKQIIKDRFKIRVDQVQLGDINFERNTLVLSYAGAELDDRWILSDMGIRPGATLRAYVKEETDPVLYLRVGYSEELMPILDRIKLLNYTVASLRGMASRRTGLPVGVFRLTTSSGAEMYDCHTMEDYSVRPGDTIRVETWDGWTDLLKLASLGFTSHVLELVNRTDDALAKFQMKVALYMAAHFGQVELSTTLTRQCGIRCDEAVGAHPLKQWCSAERHPDLKKSPIHEAVESGQLSVLRGFVHHNVCSIMVRDGAGLQPLNLALRQKQKSCASFLLTKQWSRIPYSNSTVPLAIFARMKNWSDKAKDKVSVLQGQDKSSLKKKQLREFPLVGQGVYIDGYSRQLLNSNPKAPVMKHESSVSRAVESYYARHLGDPESHFKSAIKSLKIPKQKNKWAKMAGNKPPDGAEEPAGERLPPLGRDRQQLQSRPSSAKSATATAQQQQTVGAGPEINPQPQQKQQQQQQQPKPGKQNASASLLAKAKGNDGSIPLPIQSIDDTPRPFLHLKRGEVNEVKQVLDLYHKHRGVPSREYAIQCLSAAQNFKEKPWLHQVRLAMTFTETGVRKMTSRNSHSLLGQQIASAELQKQ
ncbi:hypothetical protein BOX15_Mlig010110g1 [Macrostomum lignano]|uniref:Ubiquitin-like domain-containing protein n=2 Tax=Macrostomum lignano TaxID=282301 RepID=A0A1I8GPE4_9PLAT|nr:hypothetical protein BOX15_Mlig010110g1 [Macrostomum lignano]